MAASERLALFFAIAPPPCFNIANDSLPTVIHVHMLHHHRLLAAVAVLAKGFHLGGVSAAQFVVSAVVGLHLSTAE